MKRIISIFLICLFLLSFTACGNKPVHFEDFDVLYYYQFLYSSAVQVPDQDAIKDFLKMLNRCEYEEISQEDIVHINGYGNVYLDYITIATEDVWMDITYGDYIAIAERDDPTQPLTPFENYKDATYYRITEGFDIEKLMAVVGLDTTEIPVKDTTPFE